MYTNSRDPPNKILLLILPSSTYSLTNDCLHKKFCDFGEIKKILIFERGKTNKAFMEFQTLRDAIQARKQMNGQNIQGGKIIIHYSRLKNLNLETVDNSRGTDYTQASSTSQNSDSLQHSKTDDHLETKAEISKSSSSRPNSSPVRNDEINKLLEYDEEEEQFNKELTLIQKEMHPEIQAILIQKQSKLLKVTQVDSKVTAKMLFNIFSQFGSIEELLYLRQQHTLLLKYSTINTAIIAKEYLNNIILFDQQLRIYFEPLKCLQPTSLQDEYMIYYENNGPLKIMPISSSLQFIGFTDYKELFDMMQMFVKIKNQFIINDSMIIVFHSIQDALKIIAIFSDYEYKNQKLIIRFK